MKRLYDYAKNIPWLRHAYHRHLRRGRSRINVLEAFPALVPNSGGSYRMLAPLTMQTINQLPASMLALTAHSQTTIPIVTVQEFSERADSGHNDELHDLFRKHGSDKASSHNYYLVYSALLKDRNRVAKMLEIGLGTNNTDVASHMGPYGKPGASLRAFRDFLPNAEIFGADIDSRILFEEERIQTFKLDQTNPDSFSELSGKIGAGFDLMVDDGLHAVNSNFFSLAFFLDKLNVGGSAVVEDIPEYALDFWKVAFVLMPPSFEATLVRASSSYMFVCTRN